MSKTSAPKKSENRKGQLQIFTFITKNSEKKTGKFVQVHVIQNDSQVMKLKKNPTLHMRGWMKNNNNAQQRVPPLWLHRIESVHPKCRMVHCDGVWPFLPASNVGWRGEGIFGIRWARGAPFTWFKKLNRKICIWGISMVGWTKLTKFHRRFSWFWIILHPPFTGPAQRDMEKRVQWKGFFYGEPSSDRFNHHKWTKKLRWTSVKILYSIF